MPLVANLRDDYTHEELDSIFGFHEEAACSFEEVLPACQLPKSVMLRRRGRPAAEEGGGVCRYRASHR